MPGGCGAAGGGGKNSQIRKATDLMPNGAWGVWAAGRENEACPRERAFQI